MLVLRVPECNGPTEAPRPIRPGFHFPGEARTLPANGTAGLPGDRCPEAGSHAEPPGPSESEPEALALLSQTVVRSALGWPGGRARVYCAPVWARHWPGYLI